MKPNRATIRYTNSQWLRADATEASVGMVAVAKGRWMTVSPRRDGTGVPVGWVAVPKPVQKPSSPREDATEMLVGRVPVPKTR